MILKRCRLKKLKKPEGIVMWTADRLGSREAEQHGEGSGAQQEDVASILRLGGT